MLVGRSRELEWLERALDACLAGRGGMLAIHGEAGIGKTRLADELADSALRRRGFSVAWGRAWETEGAPPYWPWCECLTTVLESVGAEVTAPAAVRALVEPELRSASRAIAAPLGESLQTDPSRERLERFEGVASFLRAASKVRPLLLVLDDLHAADLASLELLALVARGLRTTRIVVLGTYRDVEAGQPPVAALFGRIAREAETLALGPLPREDVAELVRHDLGAFDAKLASRIFDATEGNPLFVRETLHAVSIAVARGGSSIDPIDALRQGQVGGGVASLVRGRLSGASADVVAALEAGAVLGREIEPALVVAMQPRGTMTSAAVFSALREGVDRGLVVTRKHERSPERYAFAHVLVREAIYRALAPTRRRALHAAVAGALRERVDQEGREELLATLAHHAIEALPTDDARDLRLAVTATRRAADRARLQLAHEEAIELLERALAAYEANVSPTSDDSNERAAGEIDRERAELLLALGWASTEAGDLERGREVFRRVATIARHSQDDRLLARAALGQGGAYVFAQIRTELVDLLHEALARLSDRGDEDADARRLTARLLARLAGALTPSADPEEPLALARRAIAMTVDEKDPRTRIDVDVGAGSALIDFSPPTERIAVDERLLRDARHVGDRVLELRALTRLCCDYIELGDRANARRAIDARAALGDALGSPRHRWSTPLVRSMYAMLDGRYDECEALATEAHAIATELRGEDPNATRCIALHRFCLSIFGGNNDDLPARMTGALRALEPLSDSALRAWVVSSGAAALGEQARAIDALRTIIHTSCAGKARNIRTMAANAAAHCGAREEAAALYTWISDHHEDAAFSCWGPFAFVCGLPIAQSLAVTAFACGRHEDGVRHARDALAVCEKAAASGPRAWVQLTLGEGLVRTDRGRDDASARAALDDALAIATTHRMPVVVRRAEDALAKLATAARVSASSSSPSSPSPFGPFAITRAGERWSIARGDRTFALKDVRGIAMVARLVSCPEREVHALDLASDPAASQAVVDLGDAGEVIDMRARDAYRARIAELREELADAERCADAARLDRTRGELEALTEQLAGAIGLGGRERRSGSAAERARILVQRRVREAIKKIGDHDAELGRHLDWTIRTGTFCSYEPEGRKRR